MKTTLIDLLRHGETRGGTTYRGSQDDPLTGHGWRQMQQQTANRHWDAIISSPLSRCHQFADQLSQQQKIPLLSEPGFREMCFGDWEGKTAEQITTNAPQALAKFYKDPATHGPPNGEPVELFRQRIKAAWNRTVADHQGRHILLISHAGVIRTLFTMNLGLPSDQGFQFDIPHACLSRFKCHHSAGTPFMQLIFHKPF